MTIQDWPVSYDELEPYYDRFEKLCGTSGKAGNIRGQKQPGGNPFEGWRSSEYPTPPLKQGLGATLFAEAARKTGHSPFPQPASNLSEAYVNPLGVKLGQCTYCGFCERFGCGNYAKVEPADLRAAGAAAISQFQRADRIRGHENQPGLRPANARPA